MEQIKAILSSFEAGGLSLDDTVKALRALSSFEDIGYAKVDHARAMRQGFPEVIYGEGKTDEQILGIVDKLISGGAQELLVTRIGKDTFSAINELYSAIKYNESGRIAYIEREREPFGSVLVLCAGTSDIPVAEEAAVTAAVMGANVTRAYDVGVAGLHRLLAQQSALRAANVIIAVAGMEGALPSVVAGLTDKPVLAVPTSVGYGANLGGVSALLAMLNGCACGVAVFNIDNGFGAGFMAGRINRLIEKKD